MTPRARVSLLNREGLVQPLHGAGMAKSLDIVVMIGSPRLDYKGRFVGTFAGLTHLGIFL